MFNLFYKMVRILIQTQEIYFELDTEIDKNSHLSLKDCFGHQRRLPDTVSGETLLFVKGQLSCTNQSEQRILSTLPI